MDSDPRHWITALRASQDRLASMTRSLAAEELNGPSYDSKWTIAQVLSHLGSQAEIFSLFLDAGLEGADPPGTDAFPPIWDAWNARSASEQAADSLKANEALVQRVEALSDAELAEMRLSMFGMDLDSVGLLRMRLGEHAVHTWDVAVALDPSAEVAADATGLLIDGVGDLAARVGKAQPPSRRLRVRTTGPERDLLLSVADDVRIEGWHDQEADGVLVLPAAALLRLVYGRLDEAHTPAVAVDPPGDPLDGLRRVFTGF